MTDFPSVASFVSRAAQQCGFERERYADNKLPQDLDKIVAILFMGDTRSTSILSSLLLKPYVEKILQGKYVILCSHPGNAGLFPYVHEYWSVADNMAVSELASSAFGFKNFDRRLNTFGIQLRRHFFTVLTEDDFLPFYDKGLTSAYFDRFQKVERYFPPVPPWRSELSMSLAQRGGKCIFLSPNTSGSLWHHGENRETTVKFPRDFWVKLVERMLANDYTPVIHHAPGLYDLSQSFGEKCFYCGDRNVVSVLGAMRSTGCVLDIFSGISRLAMVARCPFVVMDERQRYTKSKEFEINDLCVRVPYRYMFSFPTVIEGGGDHRAKLFTGAVDGRGPGGRPVNRLVETPIQGLHEHVLEVNEVRE
jgi:hypothetical protein